jgi:NAD(P)-dependent dehydrogenase (short-subunit alcohol dehydrogenase family)
VTVQDSFAGKNVLVTGGSRGIGRAIALAYAERGANVSIVYCSNARAAEDTMSEMAGTGHVALRSNLASAAGALSAVENSIEALGGLDIVVNNAGIFVAHPLAEVGYGEWQRAWRETLDTNLTGPANVCYAAAGYMIEQGGGKIINVSSRGAFRGEPDAPAYGASKAGLNAMSQSLAVALAPHGVFVGVVAPGFVATDMAEASLQGAAGDAIRAQSPLGRVAEPQEIANVVLFLSSENIDFATGAIIDVNGASYLRS